MITVSALMIIKNEQENIRDSIHSFLDYVDEVVIVDTGSTDRTKDTVRDIGSRKIKFFDFVWDNSFSNARNFSIEMSTSDWCFAIDADEKLIDADFVNLSEVVENHLIKDNKNCLGCPLIINESSYNIDSNIRLFPKDPDIKYRGKVHEYIPPQKHTIIKVPVNIHHIGYRKEIIERKNLLLELIKITKYRKKQHFKYLSGTYSNLFDLLYHDNKYDELTYYVKDALRIIPTHTDANYYLLLINYMKQQKHFRNCIELLSKQLEKIEEKVSKTDVDLKDELSFLELKSLFNFKQKKYEYSIFLEHKIHERKK